MKTQTAFSRLPAYVQAQYTASQRADIKRITIKDVTAVLPASIAIAFKAYGSDDKWTLVGDAWKRQR